MCGRSSLTKTEKELEARFQASFYSEDLERYNPLPNYNMAPSQMLPVIVNTDKEHIRLFRWGLVPFWAKDEKIGYSMINARIETLLEKPSFKNLIDKRRCLVPMDGFYEWTGEGKEKQPYRIMAKDQEIYTCAGLWDVWKSPDGRTIHSYTIITLPANDFMKPIHDRMPAMLNREHEKLWLDDSLPKEDLLETLTPYGSDQMTAYPVSKKVGNVRERGPELIEKIDNPS
ncbi:MAG: SOS response-associated peptidase [Saprospiraceae bacterium]|nr:SOS response-associated peptidase [Saprospiraceae bacterium]